MDSHLHYCSARQTNQPCNLRECKSTQIKDYKCPFALHCIGAASRVLFAVICTHPETPYTIQTVLLITFPKGASSSNSNIGPRFSSGMHVSCALRWLNMRSIFSTTQSKRIDLRSRPRPGTTTVVVVVVVVFLFKSCAGERDRSATSSLDVPKESPALHIVIGTYVPVVF